MDSNGGPPQHPHSILPIGCVFAVHPESADYLRLPIHLLHIFVTVIRSASRLVFTLSYRYHHSRPDSAYWKLYTFRPNLNRHQNQTKSPARISDYRDDGGTEILNTPLLPKCGSSAVFIFEKGPSGPAEGFVRKPDLLTF